MDKKDRLVSLDALRGFDMLWIMGLSQAVVAFCSLLGAKGCWIAQQMTHVEWEGFQHHDTIFPLFLFLAGAAWPFSCAAQMRKGRSRGAIVLRILRRMALLIVLGLACAELFYLDYSILRLPSVLGYIGVGWAGAALLYLFVRSVSARVCVALALAAGYGLILWGFGAPDASAGEGHFTSAGNIVNYLDRLWLHGHIIGTGDPESPFSLMGGLVTGSLGVLAGELVGSTRLSGGRKVLGLLAFAAALLALGLAGLPFCPVIKKLWTPTFALFAGAYSAALFALFYWLCDVRMWRAWCFPLRVIGMNSITIYLLMRIVNFNRVSKYFLVGVASWGGEDWSNLVLALGQVVFAWLVLLFLYRKDTFLKV